MPSHELRSEVRLVAAHVGIRRGVLGREVVIGTERLAICPDTGRLRRVLHDPHGIRHLLPLCCAERSQLPAHALCALINRWCTARGTLHHRRRIGRHADAEQELVVPLQVGGPDHLRPGLGQEGLRIQALICCYCNRSPGWVGAVVIHRAAAIVGQRFLRCRACGRTAAIPGGVPSRCPPPTRLRGGVFSR